MMKLAFATGNDEKFKIAEATCRSLGVVITQEKLDIDEIQGEDSELIVRDKVRKAYEITQQPVVVSDDSWNIPGLRGFPGPYMKSIDAWFTPQDFLNLTRTLSDRRIILTQMLAYQDRNGQQIFRQDYEGTLLSAARGVYGRPLQKVVTMSGDKGLSIAEAYDHGATHTARDVAAGWHNLATWLQTHRV